jgi:hypothetical protein
LIQILGRIKLVLDFARVSQESNFPATDSRDITDEVPTKVDVIASAFSHHSMILVKDRRLCVYEAQLVRQFSANPLSGQWPHVEHARPSDPLSGVRLSAMLPEPPVHPNIENCIYMI